MATKKVNTTLAVLREIRDELRTINERLAGNEGDIRSLRTFQTQMEIRLSTPMADITKFMAESSATLREMRETRMAKVEQRLAVVEAKIAG